LEEFGDDYRRSSACRAGRRGHRPPEVSRELPRLGNEGLASCPAPPTTSPRSSACCPVNEWTRRRRDRLRVRASWAQLRTQNLTQVKGTRCDEDRFDRYRRMAELAARIWYQPLRNSTGRLPERSGASKYEVVGVRLGVRIRQSWPALFSGRAGAVPQPQGARPPRAGAMIPHSAGRRPGWDQLGVRTPPDSAERDTSQHYRSPAPAELLKQSTRHGDFGAQHSDPLHAGLFGAATCCSPRTRLRP